jgi:hypothetical protein
VKKQRLSIPKATVAAVTETASTSTSSAKAGDTKAKTPKPPKEVKPPRYISLGMFDGRHMRVAEYQDYTFSINDRKDRRLTDTELCADWQAQFPHAVVYDPKHVVGARRDYNQGKHSKAYPNHKDPQSQPWFIAEGGTRTQTAPVVVKPVTVKAEAKAKTAKATDVKAESPKAKARKKTAA